MDVVKLNCRKPETEQKVTTAHCGFEPLSNEELFTSPRVTHSDTPFGDGTLLQKVSHSTSDYILLNLSDLQNVNQAMLSLLNITSADFIDWLFFSLC